MFKSRTKKTAALAVGILCLLAGLALAQQQFAPAQPAGSASSDVDRYLANCWSGHNQAEIELSRIAEKNAKNSEVKKFAEQMVKDHGALSSKLQPLTTAQAVGTGDQGINQLIAIDKQITDRTTEAMKQKLEEKSGAEFDRCYIGGQIACHMQASAALDVLSRQATGPLKQLASETKSKVDEHLKQAEKIAEQLMGPSDGRQASNTRDRNVRQTSGQE